MLTICMYPWPEPSKLKKMPHFALPKMWNELQAQKFTPNPTTFKIEIKDYFLSMSSIPDFEIKYI